MVGIETVRCLALALPDARDASKPDRLAFQVAGKWFAWTYVMRVHPKKPRVPQIDVLAVRCAIERKELLIEAAPDRFFVDDHYRGYTGVLVRLAAVHEDELVDLLRGAWRIVAPKPLLAAHPEQC
jgi:hypothetical protein